jgi:hypothetical protein
MSQQIVIIRNIDIKDGLKKLGEAIGCSPKSMRDLLKLGAHSDDGGPIVGPGHDGKYRAEIGELWDWYKKRDKEGWPKREEASSE